jgi:hypothetical protein
MPRILRGAAFGAVVCVALGLAGGCIDRPAVATKPKTVTNFLDSISEGTIDKVDLLFDIDNSASMGDKQAYLATAIPDLIKRLIAPNCVDDSGNATGAQTAMDGTCPAMSSPEFPPVRDMHVGIVSSSLGGRLGDQCQTTGPQSLQTLASNMTVPRHNDDQGHLLDRSGNPGDLTDYTEGTVSDADPGHFLDWAPSGGAGSLDAGPPAAVAITDSTKLNTDFEQLVVGVHQFGCGIESQMESWYRFLVQPDPYGSLGLDSSGKFAEWQGVDKTLLAQRAQFLRPDSLVAVLVLTDENDSEVDVRANGGTAWNFMVRGFTPPKATSTCASSLTEPACTSCGFPGHESDPACAAAPDCAGAPKGAYCKANDWGYDLNLRHVHEQQKYGVSVQFPVERYVTGLTSQKVPNRNGEYPIANTPSGYASSYQGLVPANMNCTNPLFAAKLPAPPAGTDPSKWNPDPVADLCNLPVGTRPRGYVYYAHIGGVPHQLLQVDPTKSDPASQAQKASLTDDDWTRILGANPESYDYSGIDPHMIESYKSRLGASVPIGGSNVADPSKPAGTDLVSGREWVTDSTAPAHASAAVDLEYACTFQLTDATGAPAPRNCDTSAPNADPTLSEVCDCLPPPAGMSFTHEEVPSVCNDANPLQQDYAKAYPTTRELLVAKLVGQVGVGESDPANPGIVSSLCPIHLTQTTADGKEDPLYGYRPAMTAIVDALSAKLGQKCLPQRLAPAPDPTTMKVQVPCLVLGTFPDIDASAGCGSVSSQGFGDVDSSVLDHLHTDQHNTWKTQVGNDPNAVDLSTKLTCTLEQLAINERCDKQNTQQGWCYVGDGSVKGCAQALLFSPDALTGHVQTTLQCIEVSSDVTADD